MTTLYSHAIRILTCQSCGAPFDAALSGGHIPCTYCHATNVVSRRDESGDRSRAQVALHAPLGESERYAQLRLQDQGPEALPESLVPWMTGPALNPAYLPQAQQDWQLGRQQLTAGSAAFTVAERFFYLTVLMAGQLDARRQRATLETAAELLTDTRHRQVVRCMLARLAAQYRDLVAAEEWLETCNPRPTDLIMDTAYRYASSVVAIARGDFARVFALLGHRAGDVPLADRQQFACELLRVHALESTGNLPSAATEMRGWIDSLGAAAVEGAIRTHRPLEICGQSFLMATRAAAVANDEAEVARLVTRRGAVSSGLAAFVRPFAQMPLWALILMIPVTVIRCTTDSDPLFGVYGIPLCPKSCDGCEGPTRTVTVWRQTGPGEWSTNGADYFCQPPGVSFEDMSSRDLEVRATVLDPYSLSWVAVGGATYLILMLALFPLAPVAGLVRLLRGRAIAVRLDAQIEAIARRLGRSPPPPERKLEPLKILAVVTAMVSIPAGIAAGFIVLGVYL